MSMRHTRHKHYEVVACSEDVKLWVRAAYMYSVQQLCMHDESFFSGSCKCGRSSLRQLASFDGLSLAVRHLAICLDTTLMSANLWPNHGIMIKNCIIWKCMMCAIMHICASPSGFPLTQFTSAVTHLITSCSIIAKSDKNTTITWNAYMMPWDENQVHTQISVQIHPVCVDSRLLNRPHRQTRRCMTIQRRSPLLDFGLIACDKATLSQS